MTRIATSSPFLNVSDPEAQALIAAGSQRAQLKEQGRQFDVQRKDRNRLLRLLGLDIKSGEVGGIFGSIGGELTQPGFRDGGGGSLLDQITQAEAGQLAAQEESFQTATQNVLGRLEQRGLGGSSLVSASIGGLARQQQLSRGELQGQFLGQRIGVQESALNRRLQSQQVLAGLLGSIIRV